MTIYSQETRQVCLRRMQAPENIPVKVVSAEMGISLTTLYRWLEETKPRRNTMTKVERRPERWSSKDKLQVVVETAVLNELELGEYCREKGLYAKQIVAWREDFEQMASQEIERLREDASSARELRVENKALKREVRRQEKALAEAAILLALRKKAEAIWGETEE